MKRRFGRLPSLFQRFQTNAKALFDRDFYLRMNGDVRLSGIEPWRHYRRHGFKEGRRPNSLFDPNWYLEQYPDVKRSGIEPLLHYCMHGFTEGRDPGPQFSTRGYLAMNPDVAVARANPLLHYLQHGRTEGRAIVVAEALRNSAISFAECSKKQVADSTEESTAISGSGLFDKDFYLSRYPELGLSGVDTVSHFCERGWREGRWPNPTFDVPYYLKQNPDVAAVGMNPLLHWINFGRAEGRKVGAVQLPADDLGVGAQGPTVIFLSHESSRTGAPRVLLNLIEWVSRNTSVSFRIVIGSRGAWSDKFEALGECFHLDGDHGSSFERNLREFCGDRVGLIYANTIAAGHYIHLFDFLDAEVLTHVHEMENLFALYEKSFAALKERTNRYIAVSEASVTCLRSRGVLADSINLLPPFVAPSLPTNSVERLGGARIILGCGTVESRKGFDIFCEVGAALKLTTTLDFQMYWIGSASESGPDPELEISRRGVSDVVKWLGPKDVPSDYFRQGHVFLLPSREDPFPLVCLEAAQLGLPVVCFDERAGGMHSFVEQDAGIVVDYLNVEQMAAKVRELLEDDAHRVALGSKAKERAFSKYSVDSAARRIIALYPDFTLDPDSTWLHRALRWIDRSEIVSFDIFDTLVTRRLSQPEIVFDLVEFRHTRQEAAPVKLFPERMETAGRVLMSHGGSRDDVDIDQIYAEMAFFKNSEIEKEMEVSVSVAHPTGQLLYNYAREKQKKIFIASDMYLDADTIKSILRKNGYMHWDHFFLSSVTGRKKESGRMYELLKASANEIGIAPDKIIHFGDNRHSDVDMARLAGLKAFHFPALYEERASVLDPGVVSSLSQIGRLWASLSEQSLKLWRKTPIGATASFFTRLGFEVTGPLSAMMALFVKQTADETGLSEIVFMARDGRIIKDAFDGLFKDDIASGKYVSHYLHLSRATVVPATFERELSSNDVYFLLEGLHLGVKPIAYFLTKAGLDPNDRAIAKKVREYFAGPDFVPNWSHLAEAAKLMRSLSDAIFSAAALNRALLKDYLTQNGLLKCGKFLVVDVGWLLNIQSRLERFVAEIGSDVTVSGCYVGSRDRVSKSVKHRSFLFDCGDPSYYASFVESHTTLFELLFSAGEPSASGLTRNEAGKVLPALKAVTHPLSTEFTAALALQLGARCYFEYLSGALADFFPQQVSRDYFFALFERLVRTESPLAHAMLNGVQVKLGGHHEFLATQNLLPATLDVEYTAGPTNEYFEPKVLTGATLRNIVIVTAAGLNNASTRYRALWLAESLNKVGYQTVVMHASTPVGIAETFISKASAVVFQRCFEAQGHVGTFYAMAKSRGLYCIGEMDDLILPDQIGIVGSVKGGEWDKKEATFVAQSYDDFMHKMDGFVVSTPALKKAFEKRYRKSAVVYRNKLPAKYVKAPEREFGQLRMIYASGTQSHKSDFSIVENVLYQLLVDRPGVKLTLLGAVQSSERLLALPNVRSLPLLRYDAMMSELENHNVLLVPLEDTPFNECKSSVKFVESGAVSLTVVASKISEFDLAVKDGFSGYIAAGSDDWYKILSRLADDPMKLAETGDAARQSVAKSFTTDFLEPELSDFLSAVLHSPSYQNFR
ncbi:glycosyltransferase [Ensifer sp. ZNC0028]|uniref:glycosyltransferase n=1 Tax=Ensifer sp. ZNC0028 TaxID=1339236 RepID=UPI000AE7B2C8|nr:glycosyltransferase [Ensifer sp. ZNC0028]